MESSAAEVQACVWAKMAVVALEELQRFAAQAQITISPDLDNVTFKGEVQEKSNSLKKAIRGHIYSQPWDI